MRTQDVDALAQFIRQIDGDNRMGAGALAERIVEWLSARGQHDTLTPDLRAAFQNLLDSYCSLLDSEFEFPGDDAPSIADPRAVAARAALATPAQAPQAGGPSNCNCAACTDYDCSCPSCEQWKAAQAQNHDTPTIEQIAHDACKHIDDEWGAQAEECALNALHTLAAQAQQAGEVVAWRPLFTERPKHLAPSDFTSGKPNQQTIDYWKSIGVEIEYAYSAAPARIAQPLSNLLRYEPAVVIEEDRGRLKATGAAMERKDEGRWIRFDDVAALYITPPITASQQLDGEAVASIYIAADGSREMDDWKHDLPVGRNLLYTTPPAPAQPAADAWPKLDKPATVGAGTFGVGVSSRLVVEAAQRRYRLHQEQSRLTPEQAREQEINRRKAWDLLNGPAQPGQAVLDGWRLVPVDPPLEMMEAMPSLPAVGAPGDMNLKNKGWSLKAIQNRHRWIGALAASPTPPAQQGGELGMTNPCRPST